MVTIVRAFRYMASNSLQLCTIQLVGNESKLIGLFIVH